MPWLSSAAITMSSAPTGCRYCPVSVSDAGRRRVEADHGSSTMSRAPAFLRSPDEPCRDECFDDQTHATGACGIEHQKIRENRGDLIAITVIPGPVGQPDISADSIGIRIARQHQA
jgi:hypothetical protein